MYAACFGIYLFYDHLIVKGVVYYNINAVLQKAMNGTLPLAWSKVSGYSSRVEAWFDGKGEEINPIDNTP